MQLGKVTGTVTATAKAERLTGQKLLIVDVVDAAGKVLMASAVAPDTVGAAFDDAYRQRFSFTPTTDPSGSATRRRWPGVVVTVSPTATVVVGGDSDRRRGVMPRWDA